MWPLASDTACFPPISLVCLQTCQKSLPLTSSRNGPATPEPQVASFNSSGFFEISVIYSNFQGLPCPCFIMLPTRYLWPHSVLRPSVSLSLICLPVQVVSDKKMGHCFGCYLVNLTVGGFRMESLICSGHMDNGRVSAQYTGRANSRWLSNCPRSHTLLSLLPSPREIRMGVFTVSCLFAKITLHPSFLEGGETGLKQPRLGLKLNTQSRMIFNS